MMDDAELAALSSALAEQPANLDLAWQYWRALGDWRGSDIRSGVYVVRAFRAAALADPEGAAAFALAYSELHANSGEGPRLAFVDRELRVALKQALGRMTGADRQRVEWVLGCITGR